MTEEDSFENYKKYLEDSLGIYGVNPPPRPLTPYMRFFFERSTEEKSKGNTVIAQLTRGLVEEWKNLPPKKKEYYQKTYEIRNREREQLQEEYDALVKKKKPTSGYLRYYKLRYKEISRDHPELDIQKISKMITADWRNISESQREKFLKEAAEEQAQKELSLEEREMKIDQYNERVKKFQEELKEQKAKILKKYGVFNKKEQRRLEKRKERDAKVLQKYQQKQQKIEEKRRKKFEEAEAKRLLKEEEKKKKEEGKKKVKKQPAAKPAKAAVEKKPAVSKAPVKTKAKAKPKAKPAKAAKKIKTPKKSPAPVAVEKPSPAKKTKPIKKAAKVAPKSPGKSKQAKTVVKKQVKEEVVPVRGKTRSGRK